MPKRQPSNAHRKPPLCFIQNSVRPCRSFVQFSIAQRPPPPHEAHNPVAPSPRRFLSHPSLLQHLDRECSRHHRVFPFFTIRIFSHPSFSHTGILFDHVRLVYGIIFRTVNTMWYFVLGSDQVVGKNGIGTSPSRLARRHISLRISTCHSRIFPVSGRLNKLAEITNPAPRSS